MIDGMGDIPMEVSDDSMYAGADMAEALDPTMEQAFPVAESSLVEESYANQESLDRTLDDVFENDMVAESTSEAPEDSLDETLDKSFSEDAGADSESESAASSTGVDEQDEYRWETISTEELQAKLNRDTLWQEDPKERGRDFETLDEANIGGNFPIIDDFDPDTGTATSCKSLDLTLDSYQSEADLSRAVMGYIDRLETFDDHGWVRLQDGEPIVIPQQAIEHLQLDLAIPADKATLDQESVLANLQSYATERGVDLVIFEVP